MDGTADTTELAILATIGSIEERTAGALVVGGAAAEDVDEIDATEAIDETDEAEAVEEAEAKDAVVIMEAEEAVKVAVVMAVEEAAVEEATVEVREEAEVAAAEAVAAEASVALQQWILSNKEELPLKVAVLHMAEVIMVAAVETVVVEVEKDVAVADAVETVAEDAKCFY